jgi:hypothetical protein
MRTGKTNAFALIILVLLLGGAVFGGAMYQEQITSFVTQQGWNPNAASDTVRHFIAYAHEEGKAESAAALLDEKTYKPVIKNKRLVALEHGLAMAHIVDPVKRFAPKGDLKNVKTELLARDGGSFRVLAQFANSRWGEFRVRRMGGELKITQIPTTLLKEAPARNSLDY